MTVIANQDSIEALNAPDTSNNEEEMVEKGIPLDEETPETSENNDENDNDDDGTENDKSTFPLPVGDVTCFFKKGLVKTPMDVIRLTMQWLVLNKTQILSGITVALAQVPEAISFSFVAGVDPIVGLQSAWIMGICTSLAGGRPGMVAGATGAVAVVLTGLVKEHGIGHLFYAIMFAGLVQMAFGLLRLGVLVRMIPHPVMVGFCNGLGIVIGVAQFNIFKVADSTMDTDDHIHRNLNEIGAAFAPFTNGLPWVDPVMGGWMAFHIIVTILTYLLFPKLTKAIPGSLAGIIMSTVLEWALIRPIGFATNTVSDLASVEVSLNIDLIDCFFFVPVTYAILSLYEFILSLFILLCFTSGILPQHCILG